MTYPASIMEKQNHSDIATFPELFDGMEQFLEEQTAGLKRTSAILALALAVPCSMLILYIIHSLA